MTSALARNESNIDNALMHQKDALLEALNDATENDENWSDKRNITNIPAVLQIAHVLRINHELWINLGYGYKGAEICRRILDAAYHTREYLHHAASQKRQQLTSLIVDCQDLEIGFSLYPHF